MRYLQKLLDRPDCYFVCLPQETRSVYVDVFVKTGRLHERDDQIGIGHLMDHYINGSLYAKYLDRLNSNAWIDQEYAHFHLSTNLHDVTKDLKRFLNGVFQPKFTNEELFLFERQSIINETNAEFAAVESRQYQLLCQHRFKEPSPYRRPTFKEAENVLNLGLDDLARHHQQHFNRGNTVIFIAAHRPSRKQLTDIFHLIRDLPLPEGESPQYPKHTYSGFEIAAHEETEVAGQQYVSLSWPGLSYENSVEERIALNLFCKIFTGLSRYSVFGALRQEGIYAIDYHNVYYCRFGLVGFWATIPPQRLNQFLTTITSALKQYQEQPLPASFLQKNLKGVRERTRTAWQNNNDLYNWLMEYILDEGEVRTPKEVFARLKNITPEYMQDLVGRVFDPAKVNLVISGVPPTLPLSELQQFFKKKRQARLAADVL